MKKNVPEAPVHVFTIQSENWPERRIKTTAPWPNLKARSHSDYGQRVLRRLPAWSICAIQLVIKLTLANTLK